jgi:uncharacterized protein YgbK (DUF1537 family)
MPKLVIIADDITGANVTSSLLVKEGIHAITFLDADTIDESVLDVDAISINAASRGLTKELAYMKIQKALNRISHDDVLFYSKRIDSTLRGNIGEEIKSMLDYLPKHIAIVVPAFPDSNRICVGGYILIDQTLLEYTDAAKDVKAPVLQSKIEKIISQQYEGEIKSIHLDKLLKGSDYIKNQIQKAAEKGCRIIVIDAITNEDICSIAKAVKSTALPVISVDPGPFTAALAVEFVKRSDLQSNKKVLLSIGSMTELTKKQVLQLQKRKRTLFYNINTKNLLDTDSLMNECARASEFIKDRIADYEIIGITTSIIEEDVINLKIEAEKFSTTEEEVSKRIAKGIAKITSIIMQESSNKISGLYTSGGDITVAVCKELGASGIVVEDEVLPLAIYGIIFGGEYHHYPIITKGGLIGDENALITCIEYLLNNIKKMI